MNDEQTILLSLIALAGTLGAPFFAYLASKRKIAGEILLTDIETVKQWAEQRRVLENEIDETRERYQKRIDALEAALAECEQQLSNK